MPKCKNDILISKVGINKLTKTMEVDFDVFRPMPECNRINAHNYSNTDATTVSYNKWEVPQNQFECENEKCINSGTQYFEGTSPVTVTYKLASDATEWAAGVITFYGKGITANPTVKLGDSTNSSTFTAVAGAESADGFVAYTVDLSQTPASTQGDGWQPSENGTNMVISVAQATEFGISSIAIFNEALDFATQEAVKVGCLTGVDGSWDLDIAEATCFNPARYGLESLESIERTITGNSVTANYMFLNPLISRGKEAESFDMDTVEKTAVESGTLAVIELSDADEAECGRVTVYVNGVCSPHDGQLTRISNPKLALEEDQFAVVANADGGISIVLNDVHKGKNVIVSYPKVVPVESYDICIDNAEGVRARMTYVKCHTDGVKYRYVYDNVLITSFPDGVTNDGEQEFSFTVTILKGKDGCFGHVYKILN